MKRYREVTGDRRENKMRQDTNKREQKREVRESRPLLFRAFPIVSDECEECGENDGGLSDS